MFKELFKEVVSVTSLKHSYYFDKRVKITLKNKEEYTGYVVGLNKTTIAFNTNDKVRKFFIKNITTANEA